MLTDIWFPPGYTFANFWFSSGLGWRGPGRTPLPKNKSSGGGAAAPPPPRGGGGGGVGWVGELLVWLSVCDLKNVYL